MLKASYTYVIVIALLLILISSCGSKNNSLVDGKENKGKVSDTVRIANDSLEYEIIIIEPGFNTWLLTQLRRGARSQAAMDIVNDRKVTEYNLRVNQPLRFDQDLYTFPIEYDRRVDYGYEVTYLLFNYFNFFEQQYNQRL